MLGRLQLESFFRINGITNETSDVEKRAFLMQAQWSNEDIEIAMQLPQTSDSLVPKINTDTQKNILSANTLFKSDTKLKPEAVTTMLGIDINVSSTKLNTNGKRIKDGFSFLQIFSITVLSILCALLFVVFSMWYLEMGMFHIIAFR